MGVLSLNGIRREESLQQHHFSTEIRSFSARDVKINTRIIKAEVYPLFLCVSDNLLRVNVGNNMLIFSEQKQEFSYFFIPFLCLFFL